jgi:hypothetical protein
MTIREYFLNVKNHDTRKALIYNLNRTHFKEQATRDLLPKKLQKTYRFTSEKKVNSMVMAIIKGINPSDSSKPKKYWDNLIEIYKNPIELHVKYKLEDWCQGDYVIPTDLDYSDTHFLAVDNTGREATWKKDLIWDYFKGED